VAILLEQVKGGKELIVFHGYTASRVGGKEEKTQKTSLV